MSPSAKVRAAKLSLRIDLGEGPQQRIGPGKIALLRAIRDLSSISAAGRKLKMSYRRAWLLVDAMNRLFASPLVETAAGGKEGGGARLTGLGERVCRTYSEIERACVAASAPQLRRLHRLVEARGGKKSPRHARRR